MADIRFEHVWKRFQKVDAVRDFTLEVHDKEFLTLVGPSGSGKSTILNILAGLEDASEGRIFIDDRLINPIPPGARDVAMVFQSYALYPHMTVRENIGFGLKVRKVPKSEIHRRVQEAAALLGIQELLDRRPRQLSGGQRQRVALGRAITRDPKAFLLDEPLSNLDARLRIHMRAELKLLFQRLGGTVIYVTHDQVEAMTMSDRVVVLNDGVAQQIGPPVEIYRRPQNMFVAGFMGNPPINLIESQLDLTGTPPLLRTADFALPLGLQLTEEHLQNLASRHLMIGVRPEDILIKPPSSTSIGCRVLLVEPMGSLSVVHIKVGTQHLALTRDADTVVQIGDQVHVEFRPEKIHLFDQETSERLEL